MPSLRSRRVAAVALRCLQVAGPGLAFLSALVVAPGRGGDAVANGETRTLDIYHTHTKESASITYKRNGSYDRAALEKLNWMLRDWRRDEPISMDPRLFDIVWEVHREVGSNEPLNIVSAYRAPETNAMLRRRSRAVAKHSQHMEGKAMDFFLPDVSMAKVREIGLRLQRGGVGYYPTAFNPFVHLDAGSVRHWPRMSRDQLARLFPDGKTVHIPSDGKPMPGYDLAAAEIEANGGSVSAYADAGDGGGLFSNRRGKSFFAALFGGEDEEEELAQATPRGRQAARRTPASSQGQQMAALTTSGGGDDAGRPIFFSNTSISAPTAPDSRRPAVRRVEAPPAPPPEPAPVAAAPAPAPATEPVIQPAPLRVASAVPTQGLVWQAGPAPAAEAEGGVRASVPLPLARPSELVAQQLFANVPLPPQRPVALASLVPMAAAMAPATAEKLPAGDIMAGATAPPVPTALAYADVPLPPVRPAGLGPQPVRVAVAPPAAPIAPPAAAAVAASAAEPQLTSGTLDRSGLKALFATAAIAGPAPLQGKAVVATAKARPVERDVSGLTAGPRSAVVMGFAANPGDLPADRFSGPAVKPLPVARFSTTP